MSSSNTLARAAEKNLRDHELRHLKLSKINLDEAERQMSTQVVSKQNNTQTDLKERAHSASKVEKVKKEYNKS